MNAHLKNCPVCESSSLKSKFHQEPLKNFLDVQQQTLVLTLCTSCGFVFQDPIIDSMQTVDHYVNHSSYILDQTEQMIRAKESQFDWIRKSASDSGSWSY